MDRHQALDRFDFDDNFFLDEKVKTIAAVEFDLSVDYRQGLLLFHFQTTLRKFESETRFISGFQESRT